MNEKKSAIGVFENFAEEYLNFEKTPKKNIFWLDTMEFLCKRLSNPQDCCPSFHVAGSKGKGSISKMIACILEEAGYYTGLYSSPHILNFNERIGTVSGPFPEEVYEKSVKQLIDSITSIKTEELPGKRPVTWFELATLLGMLCFKNAGIKYAVYEVGLGGRLDATNVITPLCSCISQIELEHTEYLGNTEELIAAEKGGIIKQEIPVIVSGQKESEKKRSEHRFIMESVRSANDFMESLAFRKKTLLLACQQIVRFQKDFFEKGPRYLKPLRQKDVAAIINVHEATISRMANEKYLRCSQGLFKLSFFFTNAVGQNLPETEEVPASKQGVMAELEKILEEHKDDKKALSDQKIADILLERGIKIARRTVAKYRSQLNIDSSYSRQ